VNYSFFRKLTPVSPKDPSKGIVVSKCNLSHAVHDLGVEQFNHLLLPSEVKDIINNLRKTGNFPIKIRRFLVLLKTSDAISRPK
jgi:hypothetical protein